MSALNQAKLVNVLGKPLILWSKEPMTGFYRNGYCQVGPEDTGNHSVAVTLTDQFLDFTASRANNLRSIGLTAGCKWCLCASRWQEALNYAKTKNSGSDARLIKDEVVPRVNLNATDVKALEVIKMDDLKKFATTE
ncbi:hypothetical protein GcM1_224016 [Golovinomyces cichoracearum]|uniref:Uncharacterized protein n=1 Tax=Golovinomyces cichoracearum TaxID=62708 RepID=A0A420IQC8_9PEZI|nr:hypothetical protein GcM1_224016 [Golovinomyces cichoracearum]